MKYIFVQLCNILKNGHLSLNSDIDGNKLSSMSVNFYFIIIPYCIIGLAYWLEINLQGEAGAEGIGVNFKGNWSASTSYNRLDGAYYNGIIWCCKVANSNQTPNSLSTYWESVVDFLKAKILSGTTEPTDKYDGLIWIEILS